MPRTRAGGAVPRNRAHGARRLPRARMPRLVSRRPSGGPVRRAERPRAEPAAGRPSRSGHELLLPQGGARRRVRLRRADPGSGPHRLAPAGGTGADGRRGDPPRGTGPAAGGGGRVKVVILFDPGAEDWTPEDIRGVMKAVDEIGAIFASMGHEIRKVAVRHDMRWFQVARRADLVFNLCEGVHGKSEWEEHVVGTLEFAGIPITGASLWSRARVLRRRLDDGRQREVVLDLALCHRPAGNGEPRLLEQRVRNGLAAARGEGPETRARDGDPREFERSHDMLFPLALPVDALAQIEHEVRPTRHLEPAHVVADGHLADLVAHRGEDRADLVHGFHHAADVLRRPVFGARVEQDDDLHAPTTARCWAGTARRVPASTVSSCPASRRQAMRTSSWISSS